MPVYDCNSNQNENEQQQQQKEKKNFFFTHISMRQYTRTNIRFNFYGIAIYTRTINWKIQRIFYTTIELYTTSELTATADD